MLFWLPRHRQWMSSRYNVYIVRRCIMDQCWCIMSCCLCFVGHGHTSSVQQLCTTVLGTDGHGPARTLRFYFTPTSKFISRKCACIRFDWACCNRRWTCHVPLCEWNDKYFQESAPTSRTGRNWRGKCIVSWWYYQNLIAADPIINIIIVGASWQSNVVHITSFIIVMFKVFKIVREG